MLQDNKRNKNLSKVRTGLATRQMTGALFHKREEKGNREEKVMD